MIVGSAHKPLQTWVTESMSLGGAHGWSCTTQTGALIATIMPQASRGEKGSVQQYKQTNIL